MDWALTCRYATCMSSMPRGYSADHHRVYRNRGAAREYLCSCGKQSTQWAHLHDTDPSDHGNYVSMCRSCHAKYDGVVPPSQRGVKPANASLTDEQAEEIRRFVASGVPQTEVARQYGVVKQVVWRIAHRVSYARGDDE